jgi:hypothetical protein
MRKYVNELAEAVMNCVRDGQGGLETADQIERDLANAQSLINTALMGTSYRVELRLKIQH